MSRAGYGRARVARYELPSRRWFIAICEACQWRDMEWADKRMAKDAARRHNEERHAR